MICPKCKSEEQYDRFCSRCGCRLKESCRNTEQAIGGSVYLTEVARAKNIKQNFIHKHDSLFVALCFLGVIIAAIGALATEYIHEYTKYNVGTIAFGFLLIVLFSCLGTHDRTKREKNFFRCFPHEADIIRRAEEGEK